MLKRFRSISKAIINGQATQKSIVKLFLDNFQVSYMGHTDQYSADNANYVEIHLDPTERTWGEDGDMHLSIIYDNRNEIYLNQEKIVNGNIQHTVERRKQLAQKVLRWFLKDFYKTRASIDYYIVSGNGYKIVHFYLYRFRLF